MPTSRQANCLLNLHKLFRKSASLAETIRAVVDELQAGFDADSACWFDSRSRELVVAEGGDNSATLREWYDDFFRGRSLEMETGRPTLWRSPDNGHSLHASTALVGVFGKSQPHWLGLFRGSDGGFTEADLDSFSVAQAVLVSGFQRLQASREIRSSLLGSLAGISATIDAKDRYTAGHSQRVAQISRFVATRAGLSAKEVSDAYVGGLLHDVGKIGIHDAVLLKPGALTEEEYEHVKTHTVIGDRIIGSIPQLAGARPVVRSHHERYDGGGYPDGLAGENIPVLARIARIGRHL